MKTPMRVLAVVAVAGICNLGGPAGAATSGAGSTTVVVHHATDEFEDVFPCTDATYEFTVDYRTAVTKFAAPGSDFGTFVETATFVAVPADTSRPTYTGHFAAHGHLSDAGGGATQVNFTQSVEATGSDGSVIRSHANTHAVFTDGGDLFSGFDKAFCK